MLNKFVATPVQINGRRLPVEISVPQVAICNSMNAPNASQSILGVGSRFLPLPGPVQQLGSDERDACRQGQKGEGLKPNPRPQTRSGCCRSHAAPDTG